jgi:hypothetical protein
VKAIDQRKSMAKYESVSPEQFASTMFLSIFKAILTYSL